MDKDHSIAAIIVTYRRPELLRECLIAVQEQTCPPDHIIVVDNCSGDNTPDIVREVAPRARLLTLTENTGSAGGFSAGLKAALEGNHEWFWIMDDDGVPHPSCLERLLQYGAKDVLVRGPLVQASNEPQFLAFELKLRGVGYISTVAEAQIAARNGILEDVTSPFNGIILHRSIPAAVGVPIREMFIWGDEVEYFSRIAKAGYKSVTVFEARFSHPRNRIPKTIVAVFGMRMTVCAPQDAFRYQIMIRNLAYIKWRYEGLKGLALHLIKFSIFSYTQGGGVRSLLRTLLYCKDGVLANWQLRQQR